jgi:hypothetical protein
MQTTPGYTVCNEFLWCGVIGFLCVNYLCTLPPHGWKEKKCAKYWQYLQKYILAQHTHCQPFFPTRIFSTRIFCKSTSTFQQEFRIPYNNSTTTTRGKIFLALKLNRLYLWTKWIAIFSFSNTVSLFFPSLEPNSWTYNFVEVSWHNLENSQTW